MSDLFHVHLLENFEPQDLLTLAEHFADQEGTCLLYSGGFLDSANNSYLALFPFETITMTQDEVIHRYKNEWRQLPVPNPWEGLKEFLHPNGSKFDYRFGFLGYELGAFADKDKKLSYQRALTPDAYWQKCVVVIHVDHSKRKGSLIIAQEGISELTVEQNNWLKAICTGDWKKISLPTRLADPCIKCIEHPDRQANYFKKIKTAQEYIRAGDIYQVNLSQEFCFQGYCRPFNVFCSVNSINPAPFSTYFNLESFSIVSTSPERFLRKQGTTLETRPIKGTIPRGKNLHEDEQLKNKLLYSNKERAELLMITDLMRNDLGKLSQIGSVVTKDIWRCEAYTNVFHLISIIQSQVKPYLTPLEIIQSCFPGGSITGCPKLRAMEIITELEQRPRGIYTGSIGYVTGLGDFDLNIAIRTLIMTPKLINLQLGGGIVIDSDPELEYQETLAKGASIFNTLLGA